MAYYEDDRIGRDPNYIDMHGRAQGGRQGAPAGTLENFSYGGSLDAAEQERQRAGARANGWLSSSRGYGGPPAGRVDAARQVVGQGRQQQEIGLQRLEDIESGRGASLARAEYAQGLDATGEAAAAAMATGPSAAALRGASSNYGAAASRMGHGLAAETGAARSGYSGLASDMRGQDLGLANQEMDWERARADAFYRQQDLADKMGLYYEGRKYGVNAAQAQGMSALDRYRARENLNRNSAARDQEREQALQDVAKYGAAAVGFVAGMA